MLSAGSSSGADFLPPNSEPVGDESGPIDGIDCRLEMFIQGPFIAWVHHVPGAAPIKTASASHQPKTRNLAHIWGGTINGRLVVCKGNWPAKMRPADAGLSSLARLDVSTFYLNNSLPPHRRFTKRRAAMNSNNQLKVFSGRANVPLAEKIA